MLDQEGTVMDQKETALDQEGTHQTKRGRHLTKEGQEAKERMTPDQEWTTLKRAQEKGPKRTGPRERAQEENKMKWRNNQNEANR